jgi:predicted Zn-dependent peptidase
MSGFSRKLAVLGTRFGSIDNRFRLDGRTVELPDGLAHFLEHELFTKEDGDVFEQFARSGASANAGTGFTQTSYYFSCTRDFASNLELLLRFVFTPYFSDENVRKERGIIGQEIRMYEDSPDQRIFMNLMEALFVRHPVRIDIAGTVESISRITPEILAEAYRIFYHPSNMVLVVVGDVDPSSVARDVERVLGTRSFGPPPAVRRAPFDEPRSARLRSTKQSFLVSQPKMLIGFKDPDPPGTGRERVRREIESSLLLQILVGRGSDLHRSLYREGLIDDSFGASYSADVGVGFAVMGGDTDHPDRLAEAIRAGIRSARRKGIVREDFTRIRRKLHGKFYFGVNTPDATAMTSMSFWMKRFPMADYPGLLRSVRREHVEARLRRLFDARGSAVSVVRPARRGH